MMIYCKNSHFHEGLRFLLQKELEMNYFFVFVNIFLIKRTQFNAKGAFFVVVVVVILPVAFEHSDMMKGAIYHS